VRALNGGKMSDIKVLILEDQPEEGRLYCKMVQDMGLGCEYFESSGQAFDYFKNKKADILLLDVYLNEDLTGIELIPKFMQMCPGLLIIVITHSINVQDPNDAIKNGAFDYILKPFDTNIFKQRVSIAVDKVNYEKMKKAMA
jgi:DNA-binding NtrC family response regulator